MRKLIDIPEENKVLEKLKILAVKTGKDLKNYIQDLLKEHAESSIDTIISNDSGVMIEFSRVGDKVICVRSIGFTVEEIVKINKLLNNES